MQRAPSLLLGVVLKLHFGGVLDCDRGSPTLEPSRLRALFTFCEKTSLMISLRSLFDDFITIAVGLRQDLRSTKCLLNPWILNTRLLFSLPVPRFKTVFTKLTPQSHGYALLLLGCRLRGIPRHCVTTSPTRYLHSTVELRPRSCEESYL